MVGPAPIGDVPKSGARKILEQNARKVRLATHAGSTEGCPVWIGLQPGDQFLQVVRWQGFLCGKDVVKNLMECHRLEIAQYIVWKRVDSTVRDM
jgi:hypothetical protein